MEEGRKGMGRNPGGSRGASHGAILLVLLMVLGLVLAWNGYSSSQSETLSPEVAEASLKTSVYLAALALEAEFEESGAYPSDLESIGVDEEGVAYRPTGDGYSLKATAEGMSFEYQSGDNLDPYRSAFESLLPPWRED